MVVSESYRSSYEDDICTSTNENRKTLKVVRLKGKEGNHRILKQEVDSYMYVIIFKNILLQSLPIILKYMYILFI